MVCVDDGTGTATCRASSSNRARVCEPGISDSCSSDPNYSTCGTARSGSSETGVCGGAGVSCNNNNACWSGYCNPFSRTCQYTPTPQATTTINRRRLTNSVCPAGKTLCPIGSNGRNLDKLSGSGYECMDIFSNLESCGGCIFDETPFGQDCTTLDNVDDVACVDGRCKINSCLRGWSPTADYRSCVKNNEG
ncbi:hypothetical protein BCR39DRAFT_545179 [Naematelia encephala]|uniref:Protein CPL1-like domain-containing protein n=1 Tax=Naematelia encephala TaxID=71784 RepID=A0A1Y2ARG5_9TREE|nr:hypothetical protein BCR39DRAFT_545179 [Naematelia encephala]